MAENKLILEKFNEDQRKYVIQCLAKDMRLVKIVPYFRYMYPDFGKDFPEDVLGDRLYERFRKYKENHADEIAEVRLLLADESMEHIPMANPAYRMRLLQQVWDETPAVSELVKGDQRFKSNTPDRLAILELAENMVLRAKGIVPTEVVKTSDSNKPVKPGDAEDMSSIEMITGETDGENQPPDSREETSQESDN